MELAPEMVAVVFHQGFRFGRASALEQVLACGQDDLPQWSALDSVVTLEPWAAALAKTVLSEPGGARFMVVAAGWSICCSTRALPPQHRATMRSRPMRTMPMLRSTTMATTR